MSTENTQLFDSRRWLRFAAATAGAGCALAVLPSAAMATTTTRPSNDSIRHAAPLTDNATGNNDEATAEPGETSHYPGGTLPPRHSVWYKWHAPTSCLGNQATVDTSDSAVDTTLAAYTQLPNTVYKANHPRAGTVAAPNTYDDTLGDDVGGGDLTSQVTFTVTQPRYYFIAVDGYSDVDTGDFEVHVSC